MGHSDPLQYGYSIAGRHFHPELLPSRVVCFYDTLCVEPASIGERESLVQGMLYKHLNRGQGRWNISGNTAIIQTHKL